MLRKHPLIALVFISLSQTPSAFAQQKDEPAPVYVDNVTGLNYPPRVGPLDFVDFVEYPEKALGYCVRYASPRDYGQICVYDQGKHNLQTGIGSKDFKNEFDRVVETTLTYLAVTPYHDGKIVAEGTPSIGTEDRVAEAKMKILTSKLTMPDGVDQSNTHMILMSTGLGKFVKFNYTAKNMSSDDFSQRTRDVVETFVRFNGGKMKAFLVERKGKAE